MSEKLIAICGGIGSGKSIVSRCLLAMGYPVYDCDRNAKKLMDGNRTIRDRIADEIAGDAIGHDGSIDRHRLSEIVFADTDALSRLNNIVHGAVRDDLRQWVACQGRPVAFVETAILYESRLDREVDEVWEICAPSEIRIERVMRRSGLTEEQVLARMSAQDSFVPEKCHQCVNVIVNDGCVPVLPQIEHLLKQ
ncbi:MAG: dephospho-CoA kinase [Duncaniella sp.]|nr:dephospho-CoA kinase [Duncaniella sp.]